MLYAEYMVKVKEICLEQWEENGQWYILPDWKRRLDDLELYPDEDVISDWVNVMWSDVKEELELEVKMRNVRQDKLPILGEMLHKIMNSEVEPEVLQEQNELLKNMQEYMKEKNKVEEKKVELEEREKKVEEKEKMKEIAKGMSFAKK